MPKTRKFGTFGGVFTPSVLTILGVIMYMRMGWVVGNAGLIGSILIIVVAHVISVTTGLSISSIATDRKVGAGGVYYVLSRSLGLPIGGAIGITLWMATSLSIALYLVGFAESINAYFGFTTSINGLRISGSIALAILATIAIISTAVAIKTQYFIMAAIGISLASIFAGTREFAPVDIPNFGPPEGISMMAIFAIFFPAVTGFTAGIAMSGDLKDPKKSIPTGTILAIAVGFLIYISLAVFMAYTIEPEILRSDYNILMKMAFFAPAVVAGIWGATLSSALGGILGGPRILQAMSIDRITPKVFSKGVGKDNEPRNALLVTLVIAECGVLIGELDMIAEVCSMFYLAAYGFINLSFFLENWASADFSPGFKVKGWIGLLGFVATFGVMFQLNPGAMFAAVIVIGGIYAYLQRKHLALSSGDVWTSVWSSLVMKGLQKMDQSVDTSRNWKPNILLFSGGTDDRPHLIQIAKAIAGKVGMVSNFDLVENPEAEVLFPKHKQSVHDPILHEYGIFGRKQEVQNVYKGIETIASTYGFSGVEPNTVLLGWARNTTDQVWFAEMTKKLIALDYNVLYLDYDRNRKFGKYQRIDVWWHNLKNNAELTLNLVKFISRSPDWYKAAIRVILINDTSKEGFERRIHKMLDTYRIEATVKVINNHLMQKPSYELMKVESKDADLILAGIPDIPEGQERDFVEKTTEMFKSIGTTLLVKTSSTLGEDVGFHKVDTTGEIDFTNELIAGSIISIPTFSDQKTQSTFSALTDEMERMTTEILDDELASFENVYLGFVKDCRKMAFYQIDKKENQEGETVAPVKLLEEYEARSDVFIQDDIPYLQERMSSLRDKLLDLSEQIPLQINKRIRVEGRKRPFKKIVRKFFRQQYLDAVKQIQLQIGLTTVILNEKLKDGLIESERAFSGDFQDKNQHFELVRQTFDDLSMAIQQNCHTLRSSIKNIGRELMSEVSLILEDKVSNSKTVRPYSKAELKILLDEIVDYPQHWHRNSDLLTAKLATDIKLHRIQLIIEQIGKQLEEEVNTSMFAVTRQRLLEVEVWLGRLELTTSFDPTTVPEVDHSLTHDNIRVQGLLSWAEVAGQELPEQLELMHPESLNNFAFHQGEEVESITIDSLTSYGHLLTDVLARPVQKHLSAAYQRSMEVLSKVQYDVNQITQKMTLQKDAPEPAQIRSMSVRARENLVLLRASYQSQEIQLRQMLDDLIHTATSAMNTSSLLDHAVRVIPMSGINGSKKGVKNWISSTSEKASSLIDRYAGLLSGAEENHPLTGIKSAHQKELTDVHQELRQYTDELRISSEVSDRIPFYYKQLFIGRRAPSIDSIRHRERELALALRILEPGSGERSCLVVLGAPLSGKSFFAESVAKEVSTAKVIRVQAPVGGSTSIDDLKRTLQKQTGMTLGEGAVIHEATEGVVFLFEDIELWWDRADPHNLALKHIINLVNDEHATGKFILTCNHYAFHIMEGQGLLVDLMAPRVSMHNFDRNALKDILLERHTAGGLQLVLNGKEEKEFSKKEMRKLADRYHKSSHGVIGVALHQWLNNIKACTEEYVEIALPAISGLPDFPDKEWLVVISQFIIHKHLDAQRIQKLFGYQEKERADRFIRQLLADGVLEDVMGSTYRLNPLVQTDFIEQAEQFGLI
ncbi:MAG: amino acid permease [Bacteroidia bacterium]